MYLYFRIPLHVYYTLSLQMQSEHRLALIKNYVLLVNETPVGPLWFSLFSGCWLILSVCWLMSFCLSLWKIARCSVILLLPLCHKPMFAFSYVFSNGGHLGWEAMSSDTILKGDHIRTILPRFGRDWPSSYRGEDFLIHFLLNFLFLVTAAILVGGQGHQTQFWKGTT